MASGSFHLNDIEQKVLGKYSAVDVTALYISTKSLWHDVCKQCYWSICSISVLVLLSIVLMESVDIY